MTGNGSGKPERVLVTGAAGFVGQHLVRALLDAGHSVVALLHRLQLAPEITARCDRVLSGDICDARVQQEALQNVQAVCHLSACVPEQMNDLRQAALCYLTNALATLELAAAASEHGIGRFVHLSAGNMYAVSERPCIESDSVFPAEYATAYFASKLAAEIYLTQISRSTGLEVVILRAGAIYGPGEPSRRAIPTFLRQAEAGEPLRLANGGGANLNFVYVADVVDCMLRAIGSGAPGIYNVASGECTRLLDVARAVVEMFDEREVTLQVEPAASASFAGFPALSIDRARETWGFAPRSLAEGLREYRSSLAIAAGQR